MQANFAWSGKMDTASLCACGDCRRAIPTARGGSGLAELQACCARDSHAPCACDVCRHRDRSHRDRTCTPIPLPRPPSALRSSPPYLSSPCDGPDESDTCLHTCLQTGLQTGLHTHPYTGLPLVGATVTKAQNDESIHVSTHVSTHEYLCTCLDTCGKPTTPAGNFGRVVVPAALNIDRQLFAGRVVLRIVV